MARRVRHDELPFRGGEVAVGHVDGDALLPFRLQAVREEGVVYLALGHLFRGVLDAGQLVLVDALGVVQKMPQHRGLSVVHAAGRGKAQKFLLLVFLQERFYGFVFRHIRNNLLFS